MQTNCKVGDLVSHESICNQNQVYKILSINTKGHEYCTACAGLAMFLLIYPSSYSKTISEYLYNEVEPLTLEEMSKYPEIDITQHPDFYKNKIIYNYIEEIP